MFVIYRTVYKFKISITGHGIFPAPCACSYAVIKLQILYFHVMEDSWERQLLAGKVKI